MHVNIEKTLYDNLKFEVNKRTKKYPMTFMRTPYDLVYRQVNSD